MSVDPCGEEADRIRAVYKKREKSVPRYRYSCFNPAYLFALQQKEHHVLDMLRRCGLTDLDSRKVLDVGCGSGYWLCKFIQWGAAPAGLAGVDLLPEQIALAKARTPLGVRLFCANAARLDFPDASFDIVSQFTVFTSILDPAMRLALASEMLRVLRPGGIVLWYDYFMDNPYNPDVRGVRRSELERLFSDCRIDCRRVTLAPPLAERIAPYSRLACDLLERMPFLCTHYIGAIRKRSGSEYPRLGGADGKGG